MFEQEQSAPWYSSTITLIIASILLPPVGLVLIWLNRGPVKRKIVGSLAVVLIVVGYVWAFGAWRRWATNDQHYTALEQHRQQQAAQALAETVPATAATPVPQASATASPTAEGAATAPAGSSRNYWTNYRGPKRDGRYDETPISTSWPQNGFTALWKQPVGFGFASFAIAEGKAFTLEQRRSQEVVAAYDLATGRELWTQAWNAQYNDSNGDGPRSTPTWDQGRLYALGATGELRCLDANTGKVVWGKNILSDNQASNLQWAQAASPLVVDDKVIVLPGGGGGKSVVAYNKMTGAPVWKALDDQQAYVSPMLVELGGRRQIMVVSSQRVVGLTPENGSLLWSYPWDTDGGINVSQPVVVDRNRFFISSGYGKGAALVELKANGNNFTPTTIWQNTNMKNKFNSSVLHNGYIYGMDEQFLACIDVNTGERKWKGGRYGYGQVVLASGHLIVTDGATGDVALVKASPDQFTEVARFSAVNGKTWNYPALAGGRLLVRNSTEMAAYDISHKKAQ
ncbi:MAG TPA: PQQ-binding-like beta-propeller repeat protein [Pyrinomonadaceae bacterium]|nr:PQQ-binding-like beta-propeller repeat protein [Pyrinomonadaceae bacterium]